jgi:hypothetical protein
MVCEQLQHEIVRHGLVSVAINAADANYTLEQDPSNLTDVTVGIWRNAQGYQCGEVRINADGTLYAEHDVLQLLPTKPHLFVEAVTAWGEPSALKCELRLIPVPQ